MNIPLPRPLARTFESAWPAIALCSGLVVMAVAASAHFWMSRQRRGQRDLQNELVPRIAVIDKLIAARSASAPLADYTQTLPKSVSVDEFVQIAQKSALAFNAALVNVSAETGGSDAQMLRAFRQATLQGLRPVQLEHSVAVREL